MNRLLYSKLAGTNIRKNLQVYLPYILTSMGMILVYYILRSMAFNENIYNWKTQQAAFKGADSIAAFIKIAANVAGVFSFIFLTFANSFVMKRRKKQLGLYSILGMERKHIAYVLLLETLISSSISMVTGLLCGLLLDKLMLMLLLHILKRPVPGGFYINGEVILNTVILFAVVFLFTLVLNLVQVIRSNTIELLKGDKIGEKEPKTKLLITAIGAVSLIIGYTIAVKVNNTMDAITHFFVAVIFVMIGTYLLFVAGSITILKLLRKNKKYYYKTQHFINVSGMIYRMKQNAAGLASICLLSTSAILVLSSGAALYTGGENSIAIEFPRDIKVSTDITLEQIPQIIEACVQDTMKETGMNADNVRKYKFSETLMKLEDDSLFFSYSVIDGGMKDVFFLTQQEYNQFTGENVTLTENDILVYDVNQEYKKDSMQISGQDYHISSRFKDDCINHMKNSSMSLFSSMVIVVKDQGEIQRIVEEYTEEIKSSYYYGFNLEGSNEEISNFGQVLDGKLNEQGLENSLSIKQDMEEQFLATYGSVFFIGIFLGALFLIATVLIIYYKQISEGFDDKERFIIMQKVGMTKEEIKRTIHSQVLMVFFLPLAIAIIHMSFALHIVKLFLNSIVLIDTPLMIISAAVTSLIFSLVYCAVYAITSKEYYKIVNE